MVEMITPPVSTAKGLALVTGSPRSGVVDHSSRIAIPSLMDADCSHACRSRPPVKLADSPTCFKTDWARVLSSTSPAKMSWRLFSFGIALAAVFTAYQRADFQIPLSTHSAALSLRDFWHRTFMQYAFWQPYVLSEQSHSVQHAPPKEALNPAQARAAREAEMAKPKKQERMPVYFISHGTPETLFQQESLPYQSWQSVGRQIAELNPTAIVAVSSHWEGLDDYIYVNTLDSQTELLCMSISAQHCNGAFLMLSFLPYATRPLFTSVQMMSRRIQNGIISRVSRAQGRTAWPKG